MFLNHMISFSWFICYHLLIDCFLKMIHMQILFMINSFPYLICSDVILFKHEIRICDMNVL